MALVLASNVVAELIAEDVPTRVARILNWKLDPPVAYAKPVIPTVLVVIEHSVYPRVPATVVVEASIQHDLSSAAEVPSFGRLLAVSAENTIVAVPLL